MNTDARESFDALTEPVLGAVFEVSNTLGPGFLERSISGLNSTNSAFGAFGLPPKSHFLVTVFAQLNTPVKRAVDHHRVHQHEWHPNQGNQEHGP